MHLTGAGMGQGLINLCWVVEAPPLVPGSEMLGFWTVSHRAIPPAGMCAQSGFGLPLWAAWLPSPRLGPNQLY